MFQGHARASCHVANSARFRPVAVMNPCMCGRLSDPGGACSKVPRCAADFQARVAVARAEGQLLEEVAKPDAEGWALHTHAAECLKLSARGWHRVQQVARTIDGSARVGRIHVTEALGYRRTVFWR